ncbi:MAG: substrate-binding domain-containing protein [Sporocytophaga sp.]|nr:substrate-binding domain-containing protein [Sporocytophaga sp.]
MNKLLLLLFAVFIFSCDGTNTLNLSSAVKEKPVTEVKKDTLYKTKNPNQINISITGSTTVAPVMEKLISRFEKKNKLYTFHLEASGSQSGIETLKSQDTDIAMTSAIMNENHKFDFHNKKLDFVELYLGGDALAIIVNVNNKVRG